MTPLVLARLAEFRKGLVSVAGLLGQLIALGVLHGTALHWAQIILAALTAIGVVAASNAPPPLTEGDDPDPTV